ncbi:D-hexose-6-phosphate mutarotase [Neptunomonas qingdaonensis]|uniref:Putative glucose-6-phosphate 1-epimerase n=1 Tax=Neptunomonas qingdaonensis TaxID=1045558 RepID=A0A1I2WH44_9GAMM|nr:D-hexose-6-phosphate mutarotase [Neptunomonas qingdaonensis]SFG99636.1 glucose-6-phosphate 1-epimerase [Neptunomonas qingdaonensis]
MKYAFCQQSGLHQLDSIQIDHPLFKATLLLQGAQIIEFSPLHHHFQNALWLSPSAEYNKGESVRGGIPICWPWFGAADKNPEAIRQSIQRPVAHGFARSSLWQLKEIKESCHQIEVTLILTSSDNSRQYWPYDFELEARFTLGRRLHLQLTTLNTDHRSVNYSQALHTYLPTNSISETRIHGAHNSHYIDALDQWQLKPQRGNINFQGETDRIYQLNISAQTLRAVTPAHTLTLRQSNSRSVVIWNPWIEKSKHLSQFSPNDYKNMFCIETANVLDDAVILAPNASHKISMQLSIEASS